MDDTHENIPKILIMGPKKSGKTSIQKVIFGKMSPHETLFLEPTTAPIQYDYPPLPPAEMSQALLRCRIIDFPGGYNLIDKASMALDGTDYSMDSLFRPSVPTCLVFVIDTQAEEALPEAADTFSQLLTRLHQHYGGNLHRLHIEVLLHKADADGPQNYGSTPTAQDSDVCAEAKRLLMSEIPPAVLTAARLSFHATSVYDASLHAVFSRVAQQLLRGLDLLEALIDAFLAATGGEKAYLLDVTSKLHLCADTRAATDSTLGELCGDLVDVVVDVCSVYATGRQEQPRVDEDDISAAITLQAQHQAGLCVAARQVNAYLVLVLFTRHEGAQQRGLLEHNVACFRQALARLFRVHTYGTDIARTASVSAGMSGLTANALVSGDAEDNTFGLGQYMGSMATQRAPHEYVALAAALANAQGTSLSSLSLGSLVPSSSSAAMPIRSHAPVTEYGSTPLSLSHPSIRRDDRQGM